MTDRSNAFCKSARSQQASAGPPRKGSIDDGSFRAKI